jgi:hypothetical protein
MDLWPSQRDTSEIGTPSARAVVANVCRRSWKVVSSGELRRGDRGLPDLPVEVVAPQQGAAAGPAKHVVAGEPELAATPPDHKL